MADLKAAFDTSVLYKYADDTTLFVPVMYNVRNENELENTVLIDGLVLTNLFIYLFTNFRAEFEKFERNCIQALDILPLRSLTVLSGWNA